MFRTVSICHDVDVGPHYCNRDVDGRWNLQGQNWFQIRFLYSCVCMFVCVRFRHSSSVILFLKCHD